MEKIEKEIERIKLIMHHFESCYVRQCNTLTLINDSFNWITTIVIAQFVYFINSVFTLRNGLNATFLIFSIVFFGALIFSYVSFKFKFIFFRNEFDNFLSRYSYFLYLLNKVSDESLNDINDEESLNKMGIKGKTIELSDGIRNIKTKSSILKKHYKLGIWVTVISISLVPLYVLLKYFLFSDILN
jgi:hypothetical protein